MKYFFSLFAASLLLWIACGRNPAGTATLILLNGRFFTADSLRQPVTAIAIQGERILALGSDEEMKKLAGARTEIIDLQGAFAMPGFIEGHGHFSSLGRSLQNLNLLNTKSWQEITGLVAEKEWLTAPECCDICDEMNGKTAPLDEDFEGGVSLPLHPNCRCTVLPVLKGPNDE